jgi:uncharacterized lipoprotein YmbA
MRRSIPLLLGLLLAAGCVSPDKPSPIRYFALDGRPEGEPSRVAAGLPLRLEHVRAPAYLEEKVLWRRSDVEVGFHEDRRWGEPPALLVEQALGRELFLRAGVARAADAAPTLAVSLRAFDEVLVPKHEARVTLALVLRGADRKVLLESEVSEGESVPGDDPAALAKAMDRALAAAVRNASNAISAALAAASRERPAG